jgi:hypothetical protein
MWWCGLTHDRGQRQQALVFIVMNIWVRKGVAWPDDKRLCLKMDCAAVRCAWISGWMWCTVSIMQLVFILHCCKSVNTEWRWMWGVVEYCQWCYDVPKVKSWLLWNPKLPGFFMFCQVFVHYKHLVCIQFMGCVQICIPYPIYLFMINLNAWHFLITWYSLL